MTAIDAQRAAVVAEAMTWLGTPWHHLGRIKGVGVDCAQFVIECYVRAGLIEPIDTGDYPRDWHIHKTEERFLNFCGPWTRQIDRADVGPGDLVLFRIGRVFSHGAIVTRWPQGIHAWLPAGEVVLCDIDRETPLTKGEQRYFTFRGW